MSNIDMRRVKRGACKNCDCEEYLFKHDLSPSCYYCTCPPTKHINLDTTEKIGNIDIRGVKRGACKNCDCEEYMFMRAIGPSCYYCTCPPTKHAKLDGQTLTIQWIQEDHPTESNLSEHRVAVVSVNNGNCLEIQSAVPVLNNKQKDVAVLSVNSDNCLEIQTAVPQLNNKQRDASVVSATVNNDKNEQQTVVPQLNSKQNYLEALLPEKLPKCVEIAIKNKKLTSPLRSRIVRAVADRCFAADVRPHVVDMVAELAVDRWSPLKSDYGFKSKGFALQVKRRIAKLRYYQKDCVKTEIEDDSISSDRFDD